MRSPPSSSPRTRARYQLPMAAAALASLVLLAAGLWLGLPESGGWVTLIAGGFAGWAAAAGAVIAVHRAAMPLPEVNHPMTHIHIGDNLTNTLCSYYRSIFELTGFLGHSFGGSAAVEACLELPQGIIRDPDYTMEQLVAVARQLREVHNFRGYIVF